MRFFFIFLLFAFPCFAQDYLFFPIDRNNVQILPQRFEYQLINKDLFRIGDALMDANQISIQIQAIDAKDDEYKFRFKWPASLIQTGEILIRDNSGKAIWSLPIEKNLLKITPGQTQLPGLENLRTDSAAYEQNDIPAALMKKLQNLPFFKFCVAKDEEITKVHICSKDLYFKREKGKLSFRSRDSFRKESFVDINGKAVNPQGMIFLQGLTDTISMRALLLSGATIDVDTRMKPVDWRDITENQDNQNIIIRAVGAEPANEKLVLQQDETGWKVELNKDRPLVYLKGEGNIPLRQEFILTGKIRSDKLVVPYSDPIVTMTYASEVSGTLSPPNNVKLTPLDKNTTAEQNSGQYHWILKNLEADHKNRRYIKVTVDGDEFVGAHDVTRGLGKEFTATFNTLKSAQIHWQHWLSPRWGYEAGLTQVLFKKSTEPEFNYAQLRISYRLSPGLYLAEDSYFLALGADMAQLESQSIMSPTLTIGQMQKAPKWIPTFQYNDWRFEYGLGGTSGSTKLSSVIRLHYNLKAELKKNHYLNAGLKLELISTQSATNSISLLWPMISAGYSLVF